MRTSFLARRNPSVLFLVVFGICACLLPVFDPVRPLAMYLAILPTATVLARLRPRALLLGQLPFVVFAIGVFVVNALTRGGPVLVEWAGLEVTRDGVRIGLALAFRTLVIGVCAIAFLASTSPARLVASLHQQLHLGPRVTYALLAGYRLATMLPAEWTTIRRAHAVRAPDRRASRSPRALGAAAFTLLVTAIRRGERMAIALETRGLGSGPRTVWRPVRVNRWDWILVAASAVGTGVLLLAPVP